jgi:hypothetical protein
MESTMNIYSTIGVAILSALSVQLFASGITIQELSTTDKDADFPVCFNGAGELLPCASDVEPPVVGDPYSGFWSGRMIYDRDYVGDDGCYDADVTIRLDPDDEYIEISSITINRDAGGTDIYTPYNMRLFPDGYIADSFIAFDGVNDFSLLFNTQGYAEGAWSYRDCHGTWSFTKD